MPSGLECFFEEKCNELACDVLILFANSALRLKYADYVNWN